MRNGTPGRVETTLRMAANHHNTLELSATTAVWHDGRLTLYDSTMGVRAPQLTVAQLLGLPLSRIRVLTEFVGGGFGAKAMVWPHVTLAAMAARHVGRPVKLVLTRPQTYTSHGHREEQDRPPDPRAAARGRAGDGTGARACLTRGRTRRGRHGRRRRGPCSRCTGAGLRPTLR